MNFFKRIFSKKKSMVKGEIPDIAFYLSNSIIKESFNIADKLVRQLEIRLSDEEKLKLSVEYQFFVIHVIDRKANTFLTHESRQRLMNLLAGYMATSDTSEAIFQSVKKEKVGGDFVDNYLSALSQRQVTFAEYKWSEEPSESLAGTLLWEFGKIISDIVVKSPYDSVVNYHAVTLAIDLLIELDIDTMIQSIQ